MRSVKNLNIEHMSAKSGKKLHTALWQNFTHYQINTMVDTMANHMEELAEIVIIQRRKQG